MHPDRTVNPHLTCPLLRVRRHFDAIGKNVAHGLSARHDHGSRYMPDTFQTEMGFLGVQSSPAFTLGARGNGCVERFIRTLKENLLSIRTFEHR